MAEMQQNKQFDCVNGIPLTESQLIEEEDTQNDTLQQYYYEDCNCTPKEPGKQSTRQYIWREIRPILVLITFILLFYACLNFVYELHMKTRMKDNALKTVQKDIDDMLTKVNEVFYSL